MRVHLADDIGVAIFASEFVLLARKRSDRTRDTSRDRSSLPVIWGTILAGVAAAFLLRKNQIGPGYVLDDFGRIVSVAVTAAGFALRLWAVVVLGRYFTVDVAIREGHELVQTGPYRFVRHPSYTGLCTMFAGWAISLENYAAIAALLAPFTVVILHRVRLEEAALEHAFGSAYAAYRTRTKRLVPFVY